eukprot:3055678-Rhodomonas_salina.5
MVLPGDYECVYGYEYIGVCGCLVQNATCLHDLKHISCDVLHITHLSASYAHALPIPGTDLAYDTTRSSHP